jgi:hypothetical protein
MPKKDIVCIASPDSVGGTFLDWSILFLSGKDSFFNIRKNSLVPVVGNPMSDINAHGHKKNHPHGHKSTMDYVDIFLNSPHDFLSIYPSPMHHDVASIELGITEDQLTDSKINQSIIDYRLADYTNMCYAVLDMDAKLVYIDHNLPMFNIDIRSLDRLFREDRPAHSVEEYDEEIQKIYFSQSVESWKAQGLNEIWDIRERQALNTRPLTPLAKPKINFAKPHCFIDSQEWLSAGHIVIEKIMDYCELPIQQYRLEHWIPIYLQWQKKNHQTLNFCYLYPHIVDAIINNYYYEIDLTFNQEIVIQHCLIYQHNLNLKTWQLFKFPNNTQELHKLLEPNIHPICRDV